MAGLVNSVDWVRLGALMDWVVCYASELGAISAVNSLLKHLVNYIWSPAVMYRRCFR